MKTGGTMNFLKRAGAILMLVAVFASSCNKYADDFKQINTKLDALAAQFAGVTQLSADNAALKAQITALQTAVAALPSTASITALSTGLAGVVVKIDAITTTLNAVALVGTATKTVVDGLKTDLAALKTKVDADNLAMKAQLTALGTTDAAQTAQLTALIADNVTILASIAALQTSMDGIALTGSGSDATALTIQGLQLMLNAQKVILDQLLANSNMYNGDVTITTGPELTFYAGKISQLGIINGNLVINTTALSTKLDSVNFVVKNIGAVIGTQSGVKNSVTVTSTSTATLLDLSRLVSVAGNYTVSGVDVNDANLSSVGGNFSINYDGPYAYSNLTTVTGNLTLTRVPTSSTKAGTTSINLPSVVVSGNVYDGTNAAGVIVYPEATTIILSGGVTSVTAAVATQITLGATGYASGLIVSAPTAAAVVDLSAATSAAGAVSVTTGNGGTVKFTNLASAAGGVAVNTGTSGTVDFSKLVTAAGGISLTGPATIEFPLMTSGALTSDATTVTLTKHDGVSAPVLAAVTNLTIGGLNVAGFTLANYNATLLTASITAKSTSTVASVLTTANAKLTGLTLAGPLVSAVVDGQSKLTSLATSGVINSLTVNNNAIITGLTLAHTHLIGGTGSVLVVTNNAALTALVSSTDYPAVITVTGNALLTSLNLSSYVTKLLSATGANTAITINTNKLSGNYTNAVAITPTTPYVETTITSADLAKLKAFVATYPATGNPTITLAVNLDLVTLAGGTTTATLASRMNADTAHTVTPGGASFDFIFPNTVGITQAKEFTLVQ